MGHALSAQLFVTRRLFEDAGLSSEDAWHGAAALMRSIADSALAADRPEGLDRELEDIELHLRALPPEVGDLYRQLVQLRRNMDENG